MDATTLLGTPLVDARILLGSDPQTARRAFKALAARWHPDVCGDPQAAAVFAHLVALRDRAVGAAAGPSIGGRVFVGRDGRRLINRAVSVVPTEMGEVLVGRRTVAFVYTPDIADLAARARAAWAWLRYADARMEAAFAPLVPPLKPALDMDMQDGGCVLALARPAGFVALVDLLAHLGGRMEAVHVAWLGSGLFNLMAWLQWMGQVHGAIGAEQVFVNPKTHGVALLGGWECATALGARPQVLPTATLRAIPRLEARGEVVDSATDGLLIREVLRTALGCPMAVRPTGPDIPDAFGQFIAAPPVGDARAQYSAWIAVLERAWGPRRFRVLGVEEGDVYPNLVKAR